MNLDLRSICQSTQSFPARPIEMVRTTASGNTVVASYAPSGGEFCARSVSPDLARHLIEHADLYALSERANPGRGIGETPRILSDFSSVPPGGLGPDLRRLMRLRQRLRLPPKHSI